MSQIKYSEQAEFDLIRLADFMAQLNPDFRTIVLQTIYNGISRLADFPRMYSVSPDERFKEYREIKIPFGNGTYLAIYRYVEAIDLVVIVAIKHSLEETYRI